MVGHNSTLERLFMRTASTRSKLILAIFVAVSFSLTDAYATNEEIQGKWRLVFNVKSRPTPLTDIKISRHKVKARYLAAHEMLPPERLPNADERLAQIAKKLGRKVNSASRIPVIESFGWDGCNISLDTYIVGNRNRYFLWQTIGTARVCADEKEMRPDQVSAMIRLRNGYRFKLAKNKLIILDGKDDILASFLRISK
jgi:hypothetical protein